MALAGLSAPVAALVAHRLGWTEFRPAQPLVLEAMATDENLLVMGPSGSGKSTAAMLAIVDGLVKNPPRDGPVLYLTDNAGDTAWLTELCQASGLLAGSPGDCQATDGPDVVFISPKNLEPELSKGRPAFLTPSLLVLDDLSTLITGSSGAHLSVVLERLCETLEAPPRRVGLSTSLGDPDSAMAWLCGGSCRASRLVRVLGAGGRRLLEVERISPGMDLAEVMAVKARGRKTLIRVDSTQDLRRLRGGLEVRGVRCQGQTRDCLLVLGLEPLASRFPQVISLTPAGSVRDLLATVALTARDSKSVSRICLATESDENFLAACAAVSLASQRWVEPANPQRAAWPVYVQQLIGRILARNGLPWEEALQERERPWAFRDLSRAEKEDVLVYLLSEEILQQVAGHLVLGPRGEETFDNALWRQTGKAFFKPSSYVLRTDKDPHTRSVDSWFLEAFSVFRLIENDRLWAVDEVRSRTGTAMVAPAETEGGVCWVGAARVYHPRLCEEVRTLLLSDESPGFLERRQHRALERLREQWRPLLKAAPHRLMTFAGAKVNATIAKLHHLLTGETVRLSNLFVELTAGSAGLFPTLQRLRDGLSAAEAQALVAGCGQDKLLPYLPDKIRTAYLMRELLDVEGAQTVAALVLAPIVSEPKPPEPRETVPEEIERTVTGDAFVAQLASLARTEVTCNKWVFIPEVGLQWILSERLLHSGVDWVNFRFQTPFQLALELAAPYLVEAGIHPKPEGVGPELIIRLLLQLPQSEDGYFRPLADQGGIARPLWRAIQDLRMAGLTADNLSVAMFTTPAKGREMKALLGAYEGYLAQQNLGDRATVFRAALERVGEAPVRENDLVLEFPNQAWSALERLFLDGLAGKAVAAWVTETASPRRWALLCPKREVRERLALRDSHLLARLSSKQAETVSVSNDGTLQFFCAGRRDAEIQEILRRILDRGIPLDQIEIAVHDPDSLALLWDKLQKHGLAATFGDGLPVRATTPGRAVLGLLQWSEANFACFYLRELLMAGLLQAEGGCAPSTAARYLERAKATWGRLTYALHLGQLERRYRALSQTKDLPDEEIELRAQQADGVAEFARWVEGLLARWPGEGAGGVLPLAALLDGLVSLLESDVPLRNSLDRIAQASISRALRDLKLLADVPWTSQQCHRLVREKLESLTVGSGRPEAGKLFVTSPLKMGRSGRPQLFLLGLEAGSLLPDTTEDAILCDEERRRLHPSLQLSTDRAIESSFLLAQQLASLDSEITLSYSCRDYRGGEELLPSRLFFDAVRLIHPEVTDYDQLAEALGEPLSLAPPSADQAAGDAEWWLARLVGCGKESRAAVLAGFPWLSRGELAREQRESLLFTPFDGWVPQSANIHDPRLTRVPISASRLQDLAACPYRNFLRMVLAVHPLELEQPDLDRWLNAAFRGTVLHETFANYHRELRSQGSKPAPEDLGRLIQLLEAELDKVAAILPAPSAAVESKETEQLHRDLAHFLKLEMDGSREVIGCEVGFGMVETCGEPLATVEPVEIDLGEDVRFLLRGRIDRIDRVDEGFEVIDYKTGSQLSDTPKPYAQGELLQHALYALVAESLLRGHDGPVRASSYYFPVVRAKRSRISLPYPDRSALAEVLRLVLEPLRTGAFPHTVRSDKHCGYCDFRAACVAQSDKGMLAKYDQSDNLMLDCRRRLRTIR